MKTESWLLGWTILVLCWLAIWYLWRLAKCKEYWSTPKSGWICLRNQYRREKAERSIKRFIDSSL